MTAADDSDRGDVSGSPTGHTSRTSGLFAEIWNEAARDLHPAYFAMVMATGIVSIAAHLFDVNVVSLPLLGLNVVAYVVLWTLTVWRVVYFTDHFRTDFLSHARGPGYFTVVAATGVLASQCVMLTDFLIAAIVLWGLTFGIWLCLTYAIFAALIVKKDKPDLSAGINGAWLVAVVGTQAVSTSTGLVMPYFGPGDQQVLALVTLVTFLFGGMLYIWVISLIFYRYMFFEFRADDLTPPYWINMGAVAITTLAGATLLANTDTVQFLARIQPFIEGLSFFFWSTGTCAPSGYVPGGCSGGDRPE
ncbi:MAG: tellurite resistance/C4-dicarboxylate transporter family protein [Bradymonadaceae bacterium]